MADCSNKTGKYINVCRSIGVRMWHLQWTIINCVLEPLARAENIQIYVYKNPIDLYKVETEKVT